MVLPLFYTKNLHADLEFACKFCFLVLWVEFVGCVNGFCQWTELMGGVGGLGQSFQLVWLVGDLFATYTQNLAK